MQLWWGKTRVDLDDPFMHVGMTADVDVGRDMRLTCEARLL
jgi:hypothetical protein